MQLLLQRILLHGTADNLASIALCREYAQRLSKAGKSARIIEYPDAHHLFDLPAFRTLGAGFGKPQVPCD